VIAAEVPAEPPSVPAVTSAAMLPLVAVRLTELPDTVPAVRAMFDSRNDLSGPTLKKALENPSNTYRGVVTTYERAFSPTDHDAISPNMLWLGTWRNKERAYAYKEDERKATIIRRKQDIAVK